MLGVRLAGTQVPESGPGEQSNTEMFPLMYFRPTVLAMPRDLLTSYSAMPSPTPFYMGIIRLRFRTSSSWKRPNRTKIQLLKCPQESVFNASAPFLMYWLL